jgi:predicted dinucleotide-binding enzyme
MSLDTIGIIGAGRLGTTLARLLSRAGYQVSISNSKGASSLGLQVKILIPDVVARDTTNLVLWAGVIILAVPLPRYKELPLEEMQGKIVIDAMNYWAPVDGKLLEFDAYAGSSSELVAQSIPGATVIKALNSIAYGELEEHASPTSSLKRRAIPLAGNDHEAKRITSELIDKIGFDPVDLGDLKEGIHFQPDTQLFNQRLTRNEILKLIRANHGESK